MHWALYVSSPGRQKGEDHSYRQVIRASGVSAGVGKVQPVFSVELSPDWTPENRWRWASYQWRCLGAIIGIFSPGALLSVRDCSLWLLRGESDLAADRRLALTAAGEVLTTQHVRQVCPTLNQTFGPIYVVPLFYIISTLPKGCSKSQKIRDL